MNAGLKWAVVYTDNTVVSLQFRTFIPTGNSELGLGTHHVSLEPGILFNQRITERLTLEGELRDWIPVGGTDFAGNIINYGLAASYVVYKNNRFSISPVAEFVGWTVLGGKETVALSSTLFEVRSAVGDTIVNAKAGARVRFGEHSDFYIGYGRALTGDFWYKDIVRVEYRLSF